MTDLKGGHGFIGIEPITFGAMPVDRRWFGRLLLQSLDRLLLDNGRGCSWSIDDDHDQIEVADHQNGHSGSRSGNAQSSCFLRNQEMT